MLNSKDYNKIHKKIVNSYKRIDIKKSIIKTDKYKNQSKQIQKEIKQREEAIVFFKQGGREDLVYLRESSL